MIMGMKTHNLDQLYRKATDASAGITVTDHKGIIVHVNDAFCSITGFTVKDFIGKKHSEVLLGLDKFFTEDQLTQYFTNHSQWRGEIMIHARNGREVWSDTTILPVFDANKKLEGIFALSLDITDKKNFEKELWFHQQKLGFVVDNLQVGLWEWDVEKQEAWFNDH